MKVPRRQTSQKRLTKNEICRCGKEIRRQIHSSGQGRPAGECEGCGLAPLHPAVPAGLSGCSESFLRNGKRVCRECAIAYDLITKGHTRIRTPWEAEVVNEVRMLLERGDNVAAP